MLESFVDVREQSGLRKEKNFKVLLKLFPLEVYFNLQLTAYCSLGVQGGGCLQPLPPFQQPNRRSARLDLTSEVLIPKLHPFCLDVHSSEGLETFFFLSLFFFTLQKPAPLNLDRRKTFMTTAGKLAQLFLRL